MVLRDSADWQQFFASVGIPYTDCLTYAENFIKHELTELAIPSIDKDTLLELGVKVLGHRLAILNITKLMQPPQWNDAPITSAKASVSAKLPDIHSEMMNPQFLKLKTDWDVYKSITSPPSNRVTPFLYSACNNQVHRHSFNVSVPLKVGRTAPMFVLSFFLHSILFVGSALDSFQCLRSLLIVSFHVFFGLPRPRCPTTSNSVMLLIQPSFLTTCPNQRSIIIKFVCC